MEKSNFDQLLERYVTGQVSEQERIKIEAWLDERKAEGNVEEELSAEDEEKIFQRITTKHGIGQTTRFKTKLGGFFWLKIAASVLLLALATYSAWLYFGTQQSGRPLSINQNTERLILNDGTIVWLKKDSEVAYYEKQESGRTFRNSRIRGEALFEVAKDETRPFIIQSGDVQIRVVGTSFNLKAIDNNIELSLLTGKVTMFTSKDSSSIEVVPNEKVTYNGNGKFEKVSLTKTEEASMVTDTHYKLAFSDAAMSDIVQSLELKFDVDIEVENDQISSCRVSIDLTDRSLTESLQLISDVLHVDFTIEGKDVTLSGSGCD